MGRIKMAHLTHYLEGKTMYGFGDSLVYGHYMEIGMLDHLVQKNRMNYYKFAVNGASVIPGIAEKMGMDIRVPDIAEQIRTAPEKKPDYICFDGLTNDAYPYVLEHCLGELTDHYGGGYDTETFTGAFENICYLLREKYPDSKLLYICPHKMPTREKKVQDKLHMCVKAVCGKWSIPRVDIYNKGNINTCFPTMRYKYSYDNNGDICGGNGTHLTDEGYRIWYAPQIEAELKRL